MSVLGYFSHLTPFQLALIGGFAGWFATMLGSGFVFVIKRVSQNILNALLGFSAGVMIAASIWSLVIPSLQLGKQSGMRFPFLPAAIGILIGTGILFLIDKVLPHLHQNGPTLQPEGIKTKWHKSVLLFMAMTLHNIPEGIVIGVGFGSLQYGVNALTFASAAALTLGIALQDFPEGIAASVPLRNAGLSRLKSFYYGQLSGVVEPIGAVLGYLFVTFSRSILPYALSFAAGAMLFVVIEELIPESQNKGNTDIATICTIIGFVVMMVLDVGLT